MKKNLILQLAFVLLMLIFEKTINYEDWWRIYAKAMNSADILAIHFGQFEKGIRTHKDAMINKNKFIEKLLELDIFAKKKGSILDAGCGVGGTSIYLAKKYPNIKFTGITVTPGQQKLAKKYAKESNLKNVNFYVKSYLDTGFLNNYFDGIFGLESIIYASDKEKLVDEVYRILKPGGRFVTVDAFFTKSADNPIMKKIHDFACIGRGMALENDLIINEYKSIIKKKRIQRYSIF